MGVGKATVILAECVISASYVYFVRIPVVTAALYHQTDRQRAKVMENFTTEEFEE